MKLVERVEFADIFVLFSLYVPDKGSFFSRSVAVPAVELVVSTFFAGLSVESVFPEPSGVGKKIRFINSLLSFSVVLIELTFIVRTVFEDEGSFTMGPAVIKVSDVDAAVRLIHSTKSMRLFFFLSSIESTASSYPR